MSSAVWKRLMMRCYAPFCINSGGRLHLLRGEVRRHEGFHSRVTPGVPILPIGCSTLTSTEIQIPHGSNVVRNRYSPLSCIVVRGMAGHSKWQNIRHIKAAKDSEKAATNEKYTRMIRSVLRDGGNPDPRLNPKLAQVVEQAAKRYVPKATIENAIKASVKSKEALEPAVVDVKGPGGCFLIIELLTDNVVRSKQSIRSVLNKTRSTMLDGSAKHFFEHKGVINIQLVDGLSLEKATDDAIVAGAEDVQEAVDEDGTAVIQFLSDPMEFYKVKKNLEEMKYNIHSCGVKYLPSVRHKLNDDDIAITEKLFERLENLPEIVNIYDNIE